MAYDTFGDIQNAVLNRVAIDDDDVKITVKQAINDSQDEIVGAHNFSWLYGRSSFITSSPYKSGTVSVTNDSATVTGTGTTFTSAMVGRKFRCGSATYIILTFTSTTEIVLETAYAGTTDTAATYKIYQDEYSLASDCEDVLSCYQEDNPKKLVKKPIDWIDEHYPKRDSFGYPYWYSDIGVDSSGYNKVALYPVPNQSKNIYYRYRKRATVLSATTDVPIIPARYRYVLAKGSIYTALKYLDMPDIGGDIEREYRAGIGAMIAADRQIDERFRKGSSKDEEKGYAFLGSDYPLSPW